MTAPPSAADAAPGPKAPGGSQAVGRALSILSLVGRAGSEGIGLAQLADQAAVARPTARRLLLALVSARLVDQDAVSRRYHLGPETYLLGTFAAERHGIVHHARPSMLRLAAETGDTVLLTVPQDDHALCLERVDGTFPVRTYALMRGDRKPAGIGAGAMAILARLPPAEASELRARVAHLTPGLEATLIEDQAQARRDGFALNRGRIVPGSWGLAVAFLWPDGRPAGALTIAAIENRMQEDRSPQLLVLLRREVALIETQLATLGRTSERRRT